LSSAQTLITQKQDVFQAFYLLTCESSSIDFPEKLQNRGKKEKEAERLVTIYIDCNNN
jgi:hypothetical protein